jgi:murein DD-endopeptidase MepM/ murein hydrolase activator NlpD
VDQQTVRRRSIIVIGLLVGSLIGAPMVMAQDDPRETLREARESKEQARLERADLARQIDILVATDEELIAALEVLNEQVLAQQQEVEVARAGVADAIAAEVAVADQIKATIEQAERLRSMTADRVIAAYVAPRDETTDDQDDLTRLARRDALFRYVDLDGRDLLDQLREVEDDLELLYREATRQRQLAISLQADLETALQRLRDDVGAQEAIRSELADLVRHLDEEIAAMAAAEPEINAIIRDAQREIAREEALAWAATSTTTTTTTTIATTTIAPSTSAPPPGDGDQGTTDAADPTGTTQPSTDPAATTTTSADDEPPADADLSNLGLIWPTTGSVTSNYGNRVHPITGTERLHTGLDIGNNQGTSIWAAQSGVVIFSGRMSGFGETVLVSHGPNVTTLYAHMSARSVTKGSNLSQGQEVGKMGSTGFSTGNHLHFEVRVNTNPLNPRTYLP